MLKLVRKFFPRARELLYAEENVGSVRTDGDRSVRGKFGKKFVSQCRIRLWSDWLTVLGAIYWIEPCSGLRRIWITSF